MLRVTKIQRMCFHDGRGIRTTVFLKGCSLHCPWCANPESISYEIQYGTGCGKTVVYGRDYTLEEIFPEVMKDRLFWGDGGGVTFSGGEPLLHAEDLLPLLQELKAEGVHIVMETSLFVPKINVELTAGYTDFYYVDVKVLEPRRCEKILGGDIKLFLGNMDWLAEHKKELVFRVPCAEGIVLGRDNIELVCRFLEKYKNYPVELLPIHTLAEQKYKSLGLIMETKYKTEQQQLLDFYTLLDGKGIKVSRAL